MEYQQPWTWVRHNWQASLPGAAFVTAVTAGVAVNNVVSQTRYDVHVEQQPRQHELVPNTAFYLPRICVTKRIEQLVYEQLQVLKAI